MAVGGIVWYSKMSDTYQPKTKGELMKIINDILQELHDSATSVDPETKTVTILANTWSKEDILGYIEDCCSVYNNKNEFWRCSIEEGKGENEYEFYMTHRYDDDDFCWQEENYPTDPI